MNLTRTMRRAAAAAALLALFACTRADDDDSALRNAGDQHNVWYKTPEVIEQTISRSWGLPLVDGDKWRYLGALWSLLGGTVVSGQGASLTTPNPTYTLAVAQLSRWLSEKLVERQTTVAAGDDHDIFFSLMAPATPRGCYDDDAAAWCDDDDGLAFGTITNASMTKQTLAASKSWRKKVMHNFQDIGEYFLVQIDERIPAGTSHLPALLFDEVFLPALGDGPITVEAEKRAWTNVTFAILMTGGFFLDSAN